MADAPKLLGKPGKYRQHGWWWRSGSWVAYLEPLDDRFGSVYVQAQVRRSVDDRTFAPTYVTIFSACYRSERAALRALERVLTRQAADLDAMGVPRG